MAWKLRPAREEFAEFAPEWDRLNAELYGSHPMFDSRFVGPLLEYFGDGKEVLCIHRNTQSINGALILRPTGFGRWALFLPPQAQAGAILLRDARQLEGLLPVLPGYAWTIDLLAIDPEFAPNWGGFRLPRKVFPHALTMAVSTDAGFDGYWNSRPKGLRQNLRRYLRRTEEKLGTPELRITTHVQQISEAITRYGYLESSGWKGKAGTSIEVGNVQGGFYTKVLEDFAKAGQAQIVELCVGDLVLASRLVIHNRTQSVMLKTAYDEEHAAIAPGRQLLYETLRQAFEGHSPRAVEFYTDATRDQAEWATSLRYIHHHQLFRGDVLAAIHSFVRAVRPSAPEVIAKHDRREVKSFGKASDLPPDSVQLMRDASLDSIELTAGWFDNLQTTVFPDDSGIRYLVAESNSQPAAVLPTMLSHHGWIKSIDSISNYYTSQYSPALAPHGGTHDLATLLRHAIKELGGAHAARFAPMAPESPAFEATITALRSVGWIPFRFYCFGSWYLDVNCDWKAYLREREGQLRSTLKRKGKRFAAEGGTLEIVIDAVDAERGIADFNQVYARSWKQPEPYPQFIPGLVRWLAETGCLRLGIARLHGQAIASQIWIVDAGKASIFKLAYDEAHAVYAPGTLLTAHLMEHVIDRDRVHEVDYLIGDDEHKKLWMSHHRERWGIVAYNPASAIGLGMLGREVGGRMLRKIMSMTTPSPMNMQWEFLPIARFADSAERWDGLQRECANLPFLESGFLLPLLEEFGTGRELIALGHQDGKLCAAAILAKRHFGVWQTFQPSQLPLGAWVSRPGSSIAEEAKSLLRALPNFALNLSLTQIDPAYHSRPEDEPSVRTMDYVETAWVDIDQPFDRYWESRGKNLRSNTRKQRTKLQNENATLGLECQTQPESVAQAVADFGALESAGWKGKNGTAVRPDNAQGRFYRQMLENFCRQGRGRIYRYRFNDKVVAMDLCIEAGDRIIILKTAYDETYKTVSPSTLMREDEFRELFDSGKYKRIEFYGKVMEWHTRWTDRKRAIYHATAYSWNWLASLHARHINIAQ